MYELKNKNISMYNIISAQNILKKNHAWGVETNPWFLHPSSVLDTICLILTITAKILNGSVSKNVLCRAKARDNLFPRNTLDEIHIEYHPV